MSSRKDQGLRRIHELQTKLQAGDILITSELSRLGRSTVEVIQLVDNLVKAGVRVIIIRLGLDNQNDSKLKPFQKLLLDVFSALSEMERELISIRTKEGLLAAKSKGNVGGRRKGTIYLSKYDKHLPEIKEYLADQHPLSSIVKLIKEGTVDSLSDYLSSRNIRTKKPKGLPKNDK